MRNRHTIIRQIEFELEKAEHGMGLPYDAERVGQLRSMLREARKAETVPRAGGETETGFAMTSPNFARLDADRPEISRLMIAMLQAREAFSRRSWSHPLEYVGEEWWADVLADPRARRQTRGSHSRGAPNIYRLRDEPRSIIMVACTKCDWKASYSRDELIALHGADCPLPGHPHCSADPDFKVLTRVKRRKRCNALPPANIDSRSKS